MSNPTDGSRCLIAKEFLASGCEWLVQFDDDTVPPRRAIQHLLRLGAPFVTGVYYTRVDVKAGEQPIPVIYNRVEDGTYAPILDFFPGEIMEVDGCGLGCSAIHRSLFERVRDHYVAMDSPTRVQRYVAPEQVGRYEALGWRPRRPDDERPLPFFVMEGGRTEDFYWCELLAPLGVRPLADTGIECGHLRNYRVDGADFRHALYQMQHNSPSGAAMLERSDMVQPRGGASL